MRLFGWDSMRRALVRDAQTYRVIRQPRPPLTYDQAVLIEEEETWENF